MVLERAIATDLIRERWKLLSKKMISSDSLGFHQCQDDSARTSVFPFSPPTAFDDPAYSGV
jgi:hypothetical protein